MLFLINQLGVVLAGEATATPDLQIAVTHLVPFIASTYDVLAGSRRRTEGAT